MVQDYIGPLPLCPPTEQSLAVLRAAMFPKGGGGVDTSPESGKTAVSK